MKRQNLKKIKSILGGFSQKRIMIIGDLILDEFIWGKVSRISPEAPVPVVWAEKESFMPGGAANVANNARSLGAEVSIVGVVGDDERAAILKGELEHKGIETDGVISDKSRPTILKTRVIAHKQQVVRIDKENIDPIGEKTIKKLICFVEENMKRTDAVIIEDYGKGLISPEILKPIMKCAKKYKKIIAVDPKEEHFSYYKNATVLTPNQFEAAKAVGFNIKDKASLKHAGEKLLEKLNCSLALITLGEQGMAVFQKNKPCKVIPTLAQEVYDVSGAGDTVISSFALSLISGADPILAAHIANCAAGIVVGKVGISVVTPEELFKKIEEEIKR